MTATPEQLARLDAAITALLAANDRLRAAMVEVDLLRAALDKVTDEVEAVTR
jgi:hypothetical protein